MLLSKHHGLGNDFLIALDERNGHALDVDADLARVVCDRRRGIGADGLIHGIAPSVADAAAGIDVVMVLFNADGSRAEISGNGIRCLGQALARARGVERTVVRVATDAGVRTLEVTPGRVGDEVDVRVDMGEAAQGPHVPEPVAETLPERFGTVDMGNPHLVVLVDDPAAVDLATEGAWLEAQVFGGVNVEFIAAGPASDELSLRVWERGAGITEACGTGACAAAYLARAWGLVGDRVRVAMPGGEAVVELGPERAVTLIGPSAWVADVTIGTAAPASGLATGAGR